MDRIMLAVAIGMILVFGTGFLAGIIAMVAMAVRREDRGHSLTGEPPGAAARGVRRLVGVGLRDISAPDDSVSDISGPDFSGPDFSGPDDSAPDASEPDISMPDDQERR
jgi:hypothetical protein